MLKNKTIKYSVFNALFSAVYIILVAIIITNGDTLFGEMGGVVGASAFLFLFVISAAIMGLLIFGRPAVWYLNGAKKEGLSLALYTLAFLVLIALILFAMIIF